ncbi:hypothetical protein [Lutispora thermophila]|uniref:Uncharacterized protein n=1 Tax=Lutispora thermophila DSM 19022 TaxID=1122184 RepID=A0A1M6E252_9FIRM|nr:hypothetical protein [Lutispora thermophila]SHI79566.1 hypothetical protein SAMN02745176_01372 [Lutispora thermophila DSM 19022]
MKKKKDYEILSLFLAFTIIFSIVTTGLITAYAMEEASESYQIATAENGEGITVGELSPENTVADAVYAVDGSGDDPKGIITVFEELVDDIRWQNTRNPILPETVKGTVKGRTTDISVTW